jgi:hypothetical protein
MIATSPSFREVFTDRINRLRVCCNLTSEDDVEAGLQRKQDLWFGIQTLSEVESKHSYLLE